MHIIAVLPILLLLVLSLTSGVKTAVWITTVVTIVLFFMWGAGLPHFVAALSTSALTTVNVLMIVFGSIFLYNIMSSAGLVDRMSRSLDSLQASSEIRFFLIAFGMTAFFEGVAGFGTPGAIVPLILIAMGYDGLRSVCVVLVLDGLFSAFGAVGTPVISGLMQPLGLEYDDIRRVSGWSAGMLSAVFVLAIFMLFSNTKTGALGGQSGGDRWTISRLYVLFVVPYMVLALFVPEVSTVIASLIMLSVSVLSLRKTGGRLDVMAWLPYALLAILLLLPKVWTGLYGAIAWQAEFWDIMGTGVHGALQPLLSPMIPFVIIGMVVAYIKKLKTLQIGLSLRKVGSVLVVLYPTIVIAQLMLLSGVVQPSMVDHIADLKGKLGQTYPLFAPFVGIIGTFITGSTTLSNIVFAPSQLATAKMLALDEHTILALQHAGASVGNAICLFNIISAVAIAGLQDFRGVLMKNLKITLFLGLALGVIGMVLVYLV